MPKTPIDYSKTIIYKICCKDPTITDVYVGHTTDLIKRRHAHKCSCCNPDNKGCNLYIYQFIRDNGGWDNWDVIMIEECNLNNHNEALKKERWWLDELKATLNKYIPSRTFEEWNKDYYQKNKDKIKDKNKEYRENNKDKNKDKNKEYNKQWYENNKGKIKEYRENRKDKIKEKNKCECGGCYRYDGKTRHLKTKKHQLYLSSLNHTPSD